MLPRLCTVLVVLLATRMASALELGTAQGNLDIHGTTVTLTHAYAMYYNNEEGFLPGPELRILLTDREVSPGLLSGPLETRLHALAHQGGVQGVLLTVDSQKLPPVRVSGTLLYAPKNPQQSLDFFSQSRSEGVFEQWIIETNRVVGQLRDHGLWSAGPPPVDSPVAFNAQLLRAEVTEHLTGTQAVQSPQVQAFLAYEAALRQGNLQAVRSLSTAGQFETLMQIKTQSGDAAFWWDNKRELLSATARKRCIQAVFVRGAHAVIVCKHNGHTALPSLVQADGTWKVD
jgi:hypothetical protein